MKLIVKVLAAAAAVVASSASMAQLSYDANIELDNTYTNSQNKDDTLENGGRLELNLHGKATKGEYFGIGKASLLLKTDGTTAVDDLWGQIGNKMWDAKIGRFEAMDLFPVGKDTVIVPRATSYNAGGLRGRFSNNQLHVALGLNGAPGLRAELGLVAGKGDGKVNGIRPAVSYTTGPMTIRAGIETGKTTTVSGTSDRKTGFGLSLGYNLAAGTDANLNFAKSNSTKSLGANIIAGPAGLGLIYDHTSSSDKSIVVYTAYTLPLLDLKGLSVTPALSAGRVTMGASTDTVVAARVRLNYAF